MILRKSFLLDADPASAPTGGGQPPAPPATPKAVAKTPIKTPNEIRMEKVIAGLEDKVGSLEESLRSVNSVLEGLNIGAAPAPVKVKPGKVAGPDPSLQPPTPAADETLDDFIWGKGKV
jgi:hypothetical protein